MLALNLMCHNFLRYFRRRNAKKKLATRFLVCLSRVSAFKKFVLKACVESLMQISTDERGLKG